MPNYTKTINLEKPLQTEIYDVDKRNANWDKIDKAIKKDRDDADIHAADPDAHANGIAGNAASATKLKTARQIILSGDVNGSAFFDGSANMRINVAGNHSIRADSADTAARLLTERAITLTGDVNGTGTFDGSKALEIVTTLAKQGGVVDGNVSNPDAWWVKLGGKVPLIIQGMRKYVDSTEKQYVKFPIEFPNACFTVTNTIIYDGASGDANYDTVYQVTKVGMNYRGDNRCSVYLLMIGM